MSVAPVASSLPEHGPGSARHAGIGMLAATSAVVVWGVSSVLIKQVDGLSGLGIACYRLWMGAGVLVLVYLASGRRLSWRLMRLSFLGGLAFGADLVLYFTAVQVTSIANATVIGALQPLLVLAVAGRLFGEWPRRAEVLWGGVAIAGTVIVVLGGDGGGANSLEGDLLAVGALIAWTAYFIWSKQARLELTSFEYLTGMAIVAAVAVLPLPLIVPGTIGNTDVDGWITIVYITLINGLIGHFLMVFAHGRITLLTMSLLTLGIPVCAAASAAVWIDEPLSPLQVGGMVVVLLALGFVSVSTARRTPAVLHAEVDAVEAAPHP